MYQTKTYRLATLCFLWPKTTIRLWLSDFQNLVLRFVHNWRMPVTNSLFSYNTDILCSKTIRIMDYWILDTKRNHRLHSSAYSSSSLTNKDWVGYCPNSLPIMTNREVTRTAPLLATDEADREKSSNSSPMTDQNREECLTDAGLWPTLPEKMNQILVADQSNREESPA